MKTFKEFRESQESQEVKEKLVASDMDILDTLLDQIRNDIATDKIRKRFERSWPKMQALAKMAGMGISKKMQKKGQSYLWVLKK
jgi:predicted RNA-binding protein